MDLSTASPAAGAAPDPGHEAARLKLARISLAPGMTMRQALQEVAEVAAPALGVNRVSIWRFLDGHDAIRCDFLYQATDGAVFEGTILHARDFPTYFNRVSLRRVVPIVDVDGDPITEEFREPYFKPLGITSMVDAPIYEAGKVTGIVCHEQIGPQRSWTAPDCEFASAVADTIARLHEEAARLHAEGQLGAYQAQIANLQRLGILGRMAAGMAHDFSNVLQAVLGYADDIALAAQGQEEIRGLAGKLVQAAERGIYLTRELHALGRGRPSRPRVIGLEQVIERVRDMLIKAAGPNVTLEFAAATPVSQVFIDPDQMERVLLNLVLNARDAMPEGGAIRVALGEATRAGRNRLEGSYVVLEVSDSGAGMDAETRSRMFEPLFTTKGEKGTGLGLAIVNQIVSLAGGFIDVESTVGQGTRIRIYLPRIA